MSPTDCETLQLSTADAVAIRALYEAHAGEVFGYLARRVGRELAEDQVLSGASADLPRPTDSEPAWPGLSLASSTRPPRSPRQRTGRQAAARNSVIDVLAGRNTSGAQDAGEAEHERGLARSRRTGDGEEFAVSHLERDPAQRSGGVVGVHERPGSQP